MVKSSRKATEKPVERPTLPSRHIGSHGQQKASVSLPVAPNAIDKIEGEAATENVIVPSMFSGYSHSLNPSVELGDKKIGLFSGEGCNMSEPCKIKDIHKFSDGYLIGDKMIDGEQGGALFVLDPLAQQKAAEMGLKTVKVMVLLAWVPEGYIGPLATSFEEQGVFISCS